MKTLGGLAALCVLAGALVACGSTTAAEPAPSSAGPTSGPTTAPATTSSAPSLTDRLPGLVERAAFPRDAMADRGVAQPTDQKYAVSGMPRLCDVEVDAEHGYRPGLYRKWENETFTVRNFVVGFSESTGKEVLDQVTAATRECTTWTEDDLQIRVAENTAVDRPEGVEAFLGRCLVIMQDGGLYSICVAFMAHGNLVSCVTTYSTGGTEAALNDLHGLLPRAVERLLKA